MLHLTVVSSLSQAIPGRVLTTAWHDRARHDSPCHTVSELYVQNPHLQLFDPHGLWLAVQDAVCWALPPLGVCLVIVASQWWVSSGTLSCVTDWQQRRQLMFEKGCGSSCSISCLTDWWCLAVLLMSLCICVSKCVQQGRRVALI